MKKVPKINNTFLSYDTYGFLNAWERRYFSSDDLYYWCCKHLGYTIDRKHIHPVINKLIRDGLIRRTQGKGIYLIL